MFAAEAKRSGIPVLPPCVNVSEVDFIVEKLGDGGSAMPASSSLQRAPMGGGDGQRGRRAIRYSMAALKNIGAAAVETIVSGRASGGAYRSLADFAARLNPRARNARLCRSLRRAGAEPGARAGEC
jgi:DNA polymerase-3 subunit alpha